MGGSATPEARGKNECESQAVIPFPLADQFVRGSPRDRAGTFHSEKKKSYGPDAFINIENKQIDEASVTLSKKATSNQEVLSTRVRPEWKNKIERLLENWWTVGLMTVVTI